MGAYLNGNQIFVTLKARLTTNYNLIAHSRMDSLEKVT